MRGAGRSSLRAASSARPPSRTSNSTVVAPPRCSSSVRSAEASRSTPPGRVSSGSPGRLSVAARRTPRRKVPVGANSPDTGSRLSATPCPQASGRPDPDRLDVQRQAHVVGQPLVATLPPHPRRVPSLQDCGGRLRNLVGRVVRVRMPGGGAELEEGARTSRRGRARRTRRRRTRRWRCPIANSPT